MSEFEYATVVVSIVLALGIADILRFLADTLRDAGARRLYWVHLLWIVLLLELHVEFWWRMWSFRDLLSVGPELALILLGPAFLFMAARILLPGPRDSADMDTLYYDHKSAFFAMMIATSVWSLATSPWSMLAEQPGILLASLVLTGVILGLFAACMLSASRRVHAVVVLVVFGFELAEIAGRLLRAFGGG